MEIGAKVRATKCLGIERIWPTLSNQCIVTSDKPVRPLFTNSARQGKQIWTFLVSISGEKATDRWRKAGWCRLSSEKNENPTTDRCATENTAIDHEVSHNSTSDESVANVPIAPVTCDPVVRSDDHREDHDDTYNVVPDDVHVPFAHFDHVMPACECSSETSVFHCNVLVPSWDMANSRIPRFVMEVAPPQFITVTRHRTRKMMDTINEEDRDGTGYNDSLSAASSNSSAATNSVPAGTLMAPLAAANSKCFLNGMSSFSNSIIRMICFR
ncbi:hypothetical protein GQ457_07G030370 [Hibiscus cannabinus]